MRASVELSTHVYAYYIYHRSQSTFFGIFSNDIFTLCVCWCSFQEWFFWMYVLCTYAINSWIYRVLCGLHTLLMMCTSKHIIFYYIIQNDFGVGFIWKIIFSYLVKWYFYSCTTQTHTTPHSNEIWKPCILNISSLISRHCHYQHHYFSFFKSNLKEQIYTIHA